MGKIVTFGEIMLRLSTPGHQRFQQVRSFDAIYGGAESNVAVSLINFGENVEFVTRLPDNDIGEACLSYLRQFGVGTDHIIRGGNRLGINFLEKGAAQRGSQVIYDRAWSSLATIEPGMVDWEIVFQNADWFHWTGITPAVSEDASKVCFEGIKVAKKMGINISVDLNYRKKLWKWNKHPGDVMPEMVHYCDVVVGNEEDAEKVFGIKAPETDITAGELDPEKYRYVTQQMTERFPHMKSFAITLRGSLSASRNTWSAVILHQGKFYAGQKYDIYPIVDRVGGGDAFTGGLIYGLRHFQEEPEKALRFAIAASCLKHSIPGDFNMVSVAEVEKVMAGDASGRVSR